MAPPRSVEVSVSLTALRGPAIQEFDNVEPTITCTFDLRAEAKGELKATWLDAVFYLYIGKSRTVPADSISLSQGDIEQSWGESQIGGGTPQTSTWSLTAAIPFAGKFEFRYRPMGTTETKRTAVTIGCGPEPSQGAPAPSITSFSVTPSTGELAPGAPLNVSYTVAATAGLWMTELRIAGPCEVSRLFTEKLAPSVTRTVSVPIPKDCKLGIPFSVRLDALDAAVQQTTQSATPSVVIVDHEPPQVTPVFFRPNTDPRFRLSGDYFAGDSIRFQVGASDNHVLAAAVWEILPFGVKDSVIFNGSTPSFFQFLKLRPEWSGPMRMRLWARDVTGLMSDVFSTDPDSVHVIPLIDRPTRTVTIPGETSAIAVDAARGLAYLLQGSATQITVVSLTSLQAVSTISLPWSARDMDLTPSGDSLLLAIGEPKLGVIALRGPTPAITTLAVQPLEPGASETATRVRVLANGHAFVTMGGTFSPNYSLIDVNLNSGEQRARSDAGMVGAELERSHDRSVLALKAFNLSCLTRYAVATDAFSPCVQPVPSTRKPSVDGNGQRIAIGLHVYDSALRLLPKAPLLTLLDQASALSGDGSTLFVALGGLGVGRLRPTDDQPLDRIALPLDPTLLWSSPDGAMLLAVETSIGSPTKVSVTDLR